MLYFGYGSNMSKARIEHRLGPCERLGTACLTGHALRFHKESAKDHSGKCNAFRTGDPNDRVWGALYRLSDGQLRALDEMEGPGYRRVRLTVAFGRQTVQATLYIAKPDVKPGLRPLSSYKGWVLAGARELGLPSDYIDAIESVPSTPDPS